MKVFGYFYNSCIWESADGLVSLHTTLEGAEKAMQAAKQEKYDQWVETNNYWKEHDVSNVESEYVESEFISHSIHELEVEDN